MNITSTEFQQNVGFYLKEVEKGKKITITKLKPKKAKFSLVLSKADQINNVRSRKSTVEEMIKILNIKDVTESALKFQNRVRG